MGEREDKIVATFAAKLQTMSLRDMLRASLRLLDEQPGREQLERELGIGKKPPATVIPIDVKHKGA